KHLVLMKVFDRFQGGVTDFLTIMAFHVLGASSEKVEILLEDVFDPEKHVSEASLAHQRCQGISVVCNRRCHRLQRILHLVETRFNDRPAESLKAMYVERDVVINDENRPCAVLLGVSNIRKDTVERVGMEITSSHFYD